MCSARCRMLKSLTCLIKSWLHASRQLPCEVAAVYTRSGLHMIEVYELAYNIRVSNQVHIPLQ